MVVRLRQVVDHLTETRKIPLANLVIAKFSLLNVLTSRIENAREKAHKKSFELFHKDQERVLLDFENGFVFQKGMYDFIIANEGTHQFQKHFLSIIPCFDGGENGEEGECAKLIDANPNVQYWIRNVEKQSASFKLPTPKGYFHPDFAAQLKDGRILIVDYKGNHLATNKIKAAEREMNWNNFLNILTQNFDFGNWTPISPIYFELEYNYKPNMPLGFSIGTWGLYSTFNFALPSLSGYEKVYNGYDRDGKSTWSPEDYHDRGDRTYEGVERIVGYKINLLTGFLILPVGVGTQHTNELRLFDHIYSFSPNTIQGTERLNQVSWATQFVAEIGFQTTLENYVPTGSTYRLINFSDSSFTINAGVIFLDK